MKWSYSLHNTMRRCQRQFGYSYVVASHSSEGRRREAYVRKQLQSFSAWQGSVVHDALATTLFRDLTAGRKMSVTRLAIAAADLAGRQFAFSASKRYREPGQTKGAAGDDYCALFEHEYNRPIPSVEQVSSTARECFERLASQREFVIELERGTGFESELTLDFRLDGTSVRATIDFAFRTATNRLAIVDWKVAASETSDYSRQLHVYGLAALRSGHWPGVRFEEIDLYEVNLLRGSIRSVAITAESLEQAEDFVYRGIVELRTIGAAVSPEDLSSLALANSPMSCVYCNHAPMCVDDLVAAGRSAEVAAVQGHLL